jgi:hypothetical protein
MLGNELNEPNVWTNVMNQPNIMLLMKEIILKEYNFYFLSSLYLERNYGKKLYFREMLKALFILLTDEY